MKNIKLLVLCVILVSSSIASASTTYSKDNIKMQSSTILNTIGTFEGSIGFRARVNLTEVGTFNGTYEMRNRFGRYNGIWSIQLENQSASGTMIGGFGKHILIGRISIDGRDRMLPIIGFIGFRNETFVGRFMSLIGPALYFQGTHT